MCLVNVLRREKPEGQMGNLPSNFLEYFGDWTV